MGPVKQPSACSAEVTATLIASRWKIVILWYLFQGVKRFSNCDELSPLYFYR